MFGRNYGRASPFLRRKRTSAIPNQQPPAESTYHSREAVQTTSASSIIASLNAVTVRLKVVFSEVSSALK
jgi:hypothetical protein